MRNGTEVRDEQGSCRSSRAAHACATIVEVLREIFDESAYSRFLLRNQMPRSPRSYRQFLLENELAKARRPRCC